MVTVSEHFHLDRGQESLEFVNVDINNDNPVFLDPSAIRFAGTPLSQRCTSLIQSFFQTLLEGIRAGNRLDSLALLHWLRETRETRLGYSKIGINGRGLGDGVLAARLFERLSHSKAATTGLLQDLEDSTLFIDRIAEDIVSDIITNITREPLVQYTLAVCKKYEIPVAEGVAVEVWNASNLGWRSSFVSLPVVNNIPLILVPKTFVRARSVYDAGKFYTHYSIPTLQDIHYRRGDLVRLLKGGGTAPAFKKQVKERYPKAKETNELVALDSPDLVENFSRHVEETYRLMGHGELATHLREEPPNWNHLLNDVLTTPVGKERANDYHKAVEDLLSALMFPSLTDPVHEHNIYGGRKRIDITFTNSARSGFFNWLHSIHGIACSYVPVECKNYGQELRNPEIDQLAGRFSVQRGKFGLLCHRGFGDKKILLERCRDLVKGKNEYIITLDDTDLKALVAAREADESLDKIFAAKFRDLVS